MARLSDSITYGNHAITGDVEVGGTLTVDGDVYLGGTVDGRNVSSDGSKLDNIESNATADQTKADIDALNIDADTLDGIDSLGFDAAGAADTAVSDHVALPDPHSQYAELSGGADANFTAMPQVGGDPIVESGSNSNGEYTKFADGTLLCWANVKVDFLSGKQLGTTWTFPVEPAYGSVRTVMGTPVRYDESGTNDTQLGTINISDFLSAACVDAASSRNNDNMVLRVFLADAASGAFVSGDYARVSLSLIGRWF